MMLYVRCLFILVLLQAAFFSASAQPRLDSLLNELANARTPKERYDACQKLSSEFQKTDPDKCKQYADEALKEAKAIGEKKLIADAYHTLGNALTAQGKYDEALQVDSICLRIREEINDTLGLGKICNNIGLTLSNKGDCRQALKYFERSIEYRKQANDEKGLPRSYTNLGLCYSELGEYDKALDYYMRALKLSEQFNDKDGQASALHNIAGIYNNQEQTKEALDYYFRALKIKEELGVKKSIGNTTGNIGIIYQSLEEYDKALEYQLRTLKLREEINDKKGLGTTLNNIGSIFRDLGEYDKALEYADRSFKVREEIGDKGGMAHALANKAEIKKLLGKNAEALKDMEQSVELFEKMDAKGSLISNYQLLAELYSKTGSSDKAYEALKKCLALKDTVFKSDNQKRIADMQTKYESEQKQKAIELLKKENEIKDLQEKRNLTYFLAAGLVFLGLLFFVYNRYQIKQRANLQLEGAYKEIARKNKDITDSIRYAKRIQEAILPPSKVVKKYVVDSFIYYKPKDIVSGDFYWMEHRDNKTLFAAVDCTGHGVPGAFMSIVGHNLLNQIVNERGKTAPAVILDELNVSLCETLTAEEDAVKDGMDIALCCIDFDSNILQYAGAYNSLYIVRRGNEPLSFLDNGEGLKMTSITKDGTTLTEIKADKLPIGSDSEGTTRKFTNREIRLVKGDVFYIFSDGYADQFGLSAEAKAKAEGVLRDRNSSAKQVNFAKATLTEGKKFKYNQFKNLLIAIHDKPMDEQKQVLETTIVKWMDGREQVDDILVIGVKI